MHLKYRIMLFWILMIMLPRNRIDAQKREKRKTNSMGTMSNLKEKKDYYRDLVSAALRKIVQSPKFESMFQERADIGNIHRFNRVLGLNSFLNSKKGKKADATTGHQKTHLAPAKGGHNRFVEGDFKPFFDILKKARQLDFVEKCGRVENCFIPGKEHMPEMLDKYTKYNETIITNMSLADLRRFVVESSDKFLSLQGVRAEDEVIGLASSSALQLEIEQVGQVGGHMSLTPPVTMSLMGCHDAKKISCMDRDMYRTITGMCNNKRMAFWGSNTSLLIREIGPLYADNRNEPRGGRSSAGPHCGPIQDTTLPNPGCEANANRLLPNPRRITVEFNTNRMNHSQAPLFNSLFVFFGQFLDHDITLTPEITLEKDEKCCRDNLYKCFNLYHPPASNLSRPAPGTCNYYPEEAENLIKPTTDFAPNLEMSRTCMAFGRSINYCGAPDAWEQCNVNTAFIDASVVYSSSAERLMKLRELSNGQMKMAPNNLLPLVDFNPSNLRAGDVRAQENVLITSLHTIFLREHNRLAMELKEVLPEATDEQLFQEARRIVWAEMQSIVYGSFLPTLLGVDMVKDYDLFNDMSHQYDPNVNPGIINAFATAAYRFGHSAVPTKFDRKDIVTGEIKEKVSLRQAFFNSSLYYLHNGGALDEMINGMMFQIGEEVDRHVTKELTDNLFSITIRYGHDLIARNIQRGRDHGLPGYMAYRNHFGLQSACTWEVPPPEIDPADWKLLSKLYTAPADIDLFVGGLAERHHRGGLVGVTFSKIIAKQFHNLKFGDRFFFTFTGSENFNPFSGDQIMALAKRTLGDVICDNTNIQKVPSDIFSFRSYEKSCDTRSPLEGRLFADHP